MREAKPFDLFLLILLGLIWGSSFFNIKIATYTYEPFTLALVRVFFACLPLVFLCFFKKIKILGFSKNWKPYAVIGLCNIVIPFILIDDGYTEMKSNQIYHDHLVKDFIGIEKIIEKYLHD